MNILGWFVQSYFNAFSQIRQERAAETEQKRQMQLATKG